MSASSYHAFANFCKGPPRDDVDSGCPYSTLYVDCSSPMGTSMDTLIKQQEGETVMIHCSEKSTRQEHFLDLTDRVNNPLEVT